MLIATNSLLINPAIAKSLPYDTAKDFAPVSMIAVQPVALVANKSFEGSTVADVVAAAKKQPTNYTSPGPRGVGDLAGQMLKQRAGIPAENFTHINYNGSAPALTDVIAGRVPLMFDIWHSARRYVESGELKLIASASAERLPGAANVPTIAETYPGVEVIAFNAIVAPGGTPAADRREAFGRHPRDRRVRRLQGQDKNLGINAYGNTPAELSRLDAAGDRALEGSRQGREHQSRMTQHDRTRRHRLRRASERAGRHGAAAAISTPSGADSWSTAGINSLESTQLSDRNRR